MAVRPGALLPKITTRTFRPTNLKTPLQKTTNIAPSKQSQPPSKKLPPNFFGSNQADQHFKEHRASYDRTEQQQASNPYTNLCHTGVCMLRSMLR
jgi:hypothetical protein